MGNQTYLVEAANFSLRSRSNCGGAVTALLQYALESGSVDAVFTVARGIDEYDVRPVFITDPEDLPRTAGTLYTGTQILAKDIRNYLSGAGYTRLALVGKGCDISAVYELAKRNQIDLDNVFMIGLNCHGTIPPAAGRRWAQAVSALPALRKSPDAQGMLGVRTRARLDLTALLQQPGDKPLPEAYHGLLAARAAAQQVPVDTPADLAELSDPRRDNCRRCTWKIPRNADLACGHWGVTGEHVGRTTFIEVCSARGGSFLRKAAARGIVRLSEPTAEGLASRRETEEHMHRVAAEWRSKHFTLPADARKRLAFLEREASRCIKCYSCVDVCPVCYCVDCQLKSGPAAAPGRIPPPFLFHVTRILHVAESCINCGQCEDACPMDIPLAKIMHRCQAALQEQFGHVPGIDLELPYSQRI